MSGGFWTKFLLKCIFSRFFCVGLVYNQYEKCQHIEKIIFYHMKVRNKDFYRNLPTQNRFLEKVVFGSQSPKKKCFIYLFHSYSSKFSISWYLCGRMSSPNRLRNAKNVKFGKNPKGVHHRSFSKKMSQLVLPFFLYLFYLIFCAE